MGQEYKRSNEQRRNQLINGEEYSVDGDEIRVTNADDSLETFPIPKNWTSALKLINEMSVKDFHSLAGPMEAVEFSSFHEIGEDTIDTTKVEQLLNDLVKYFQAVDSDIFMMEIKKIQLEEFLKIEPTEQNPMARDIITETIETLEKFLTWNFNSLKEITKNISVVNRASQHILAGIMSISANQNALTSAENILKLMKYAGDFQENVKNAREKIRQQIRDIRRKVENQISNLLPLSDILSRLNTKAQKHFTELSQAMQEWEWTEDDINFFNELVDQYRESEKTNFPSQEISENPSIRELKRLKEDGGRYFSETRKVLTDLIKQSKRLPQEATDYFEKEYDLQKNYYKAFTQSIGTSISQLTVVTTSRQAEQNRASLFAQGNQGTLCLPPNPTATTAMVTNQSPVPDQGEILIAPPNKCKIYEDILHHKVLRLALFNILSQEEQQSILLSADNNKRAMRNMELSEQQNKNIDSVFLQALERIGNNISEQKRLLQEIQFILKKIPQENRSSIGKEELKKGLYFLDSFWRKGAGILSEEVDDRNIDYLGAYQKTETEYVYSDGNQRVFEEMEGLNVEQIIENGIKMSVEKIPISSVERINTGTVCVVFKKEHPIFKSERVLYSLNWADSDNSELKLWKPRSFSFVVSLEITKYERFILTVIEKGKERFYVYNGLDQKRKYGPMEKPIKGDDGRRYCKIIGEDRYYCLESDHVESSIPKKKHSTS